MIFTRGVIGKFWHRGSSRIAANLSSRQSRYRHSPSNSGTGQGTPDGSCSLLSYPLTILNSIVVHLHFFFVFRHHWRIYQPFSSSSCSFGTSDVFRFVRRTVRIVVFDWVVDQACALPFFLFSFLLLLLEFFKVWILSSKLMFSSITFRLFLDSKDCMLMDSTGFCILWSLWHIFVLKISFC